jgi:hypothetical protein
MPAEHVGGVTAFAVTVTGVATELPFAGAVMVTMPFEVEPNAHEASNNMHAVVTDFTHDMSTRSDWLAMELFSRIHI